MVAQASGFGLPHLSSEWMLVTPDLAQRWIQEHRFPRQRPLSAASVDMLIGAILRDEFEPGTIEFYQTPEGVFLTDGQHRLDAIARAGRTVPLNVVRKTGSYRHAEAAYARTDRGRQRTYNDCYKAIGLAASLELTETQTRLVGTAMVPIIAGFENPGRHPATRSFDLRAELAREWLDEAMAIFALYAGQPARWVQRLTASVPFAIALVTYRHAPLLAREFWGAVASQEYLKRGEAEHTLMRWLQENPFHAGIGQPRYARAISCAWNARVDGRMLSYIKPSEQMLSRPLLLRGTPYDGRDVQLPRPTVLPANEDQP